MYLLINFKLQLTNFKTFKTKKPTQMACFQQVEHFQTLLKNPEDRKNCELTSDFVHNKKCILQIKIFGADELLSVICPSIIVTENIALLIDNYCKLQLKKVDSLWINKCKFAVYYSKFKRFF